MSFKRKSRVPKEAAKENEYEVIEGASVANLADVEKTAQPDTTEKPAIGKLLQKYLITYIFS